MRIPSWLHVILIGAAIVAVLLACGTEEGERGMTGECPDGETCSDLTPEGLQFSSTAPSDWLGPIPAIAADGQMRMRFDARGAYPTPPFTADFAGDEIEVTQALLTSLGEGELLLEGRAAGSGLLRITAQDGTGLLDRITLRAANVAVMRPRPLTLLVKLEAYDGEWHYFGGLQTLSILGELEGGSGEQIVDETLLIAADVELAPGAVTDVWDRADLDVRSADQVSVTLTRASGDSTTELLTAVTEIDEVVYTPARSADLEVEDEVCFVPRLGGIPVFGVELSWSWDEAGADPQVLDPVRPCVSLSGSGTRTIVVSLDENEWRFDVEIGSGRPPSSPLRSTTPLASEPGDRAG